MKISDFTMPEIEYLRQQCNFTEDQDKLFLLRTKDMPLEECAEVLNVSVSTVKRANRRIKEKINKIMA